MNSRIFFEIQTYLKKQRMTDWATQIENLYVRWQGALERVHELEVELTRLRQRDNYKLDESSGYWRVAGEKRIDGPFCPLCYEGKGKTLRLHNTAYEERACLACKNFYPLRTLRPYEYGEV